ncbi:hypothetical protein CWI84_02090 [Idiomarina tyrosinivorans]|uniref:DUF4168 domain-containing protein n=1 Tax=Idiomarina tyrosinivorans TaxID=1445662 RepID=A0A432ZSR5_9GAMM|nr:DUF4168 domain-containing protein [Idiomarina tyrosinivorans]RUO80929.1 hypothetical protein CWI84_02090 [Idiomarina tyrosinivorans]
MKKTAIIASVLLAASATAGAATQQSGMQQNAAMQQAQTAVKISDAQLLKFINAMKGVREVTQKFTTKLQNAGGQEEAKSIQKEAQQAMVQAVKDAGMTPKEYNQVVQRAQSSPELQKRLKDMMSDK